MALLSLAGPVNGMGEAGQAAKAEAAPKHSPSPQAINLVNQGNSLLEKNDFSGAQAAFQQAIQLDSGFIAAHRGLGIALWQQGELGPACQELGQVVRLKPESARAHYELGQLEWQIYSSGAEKAAATAGLTAHEFRSLALSDVQKAVSISPRDFKMRLELAEMEVQAGQKKQAQVDALEAVSLAKSASERSLAHVALARAWLASDDQMRAEAEYKKAIAEDPSNGRAYFGLGQISLFQQNPSKAEAYFQQAIQVSPDLAPAYSALAQLFADTHQRAEARAMFEKAVTLNPQDWQSQYDLAKLEMETGEWERAKERFTNILTNQPDFLQAAEQLALMRLRQGDVQGAIAQAQTLVARHPHAAEGHHVLALAFWRQRQTDASLGECALALAADPQSKSMLALQSLELWQTNRKRDAQRILEQLVRRDPSVFSALNFCRLIVCGSTDISVVGDFLHRNRWILEPQPGQ